MSEKMTDDRALALVDETLGYLEKIAPSPFGGVNESPAIFYARLYEFRQSRNYLAARLAKTATAAFIAPPGEYELTLTIKDKQPVT